jgi:NAD(P)-dependent dehydrogenase (short-subunit alcohol dehydrogenase family)
VRREEDMAAMAERTLERFGRIDVLVHCAGILRGKGRPPRMLAEMSAEEWDDVIATNLRGTFLANRAVIPAMLRSRAGQIVNLSSTSGRIGRAFDSAYCASKFGVIGLSESLAEEVRSFGIKVMVVCPDAVDTPLWDQNGPIRAPENALSPERVADLIGYLVGLPPDTILQNIVVMPFATRRRKKRPAGGSAEGGVVSAWAPKVRIIVGHRGPACARRWS